MIFKFSGKSLASHSSRKTARQTALKIPRQRGFVIILITFTILIASFLSVMTVYNQAFGEYNKVRLRGDYVKAKYHAQSWLAFAIDILKKIPEKQLYMFGMFDGPKPLNYGDKAEIMLEITDETGKINLNYLVNDFDGSMNTTIRSMLDRLAEGLGMNVDKWDAVVDWIDDNSLKMPYGYEADDYAAMDPPARAKNAPLHSVEELLFIPGFDTWALYADRRTEEEKNQYSKDFLSDEELMAVKDDDFRLITNITSYKLESYQAGDYKININSAPYHVILALSEFMTPAIARAIIVARIKNGGYFANKSADLSKITELNLPSTKNNTVLQEIEKNIIFDGKIYKIIVEVSIGSKTARIMGMYDTTAKKLVSYME